MTYRSSFKLVVLLTFGLCGLTSFAQQFTVQNVTGNQFEFLDDSTLVTYTVALSGASLTNVVPKLTPPACSYNTSGISYFSTSYAGVDGATIPGPINSWTSGTTRQISFYVHLYDESDICSAGLGSACSQAQTVFDLSFTFAGGADPVSAPATDLLRLNLPSSSVRMDLSPPVYSWDPSICIPFTNPNQDYFGELQFGSLNFDASDPNQRVILALDWYADRNPGEDPVELFRLFSTFIVYVDAGFHAVTLHTESNLGHLQLVDLPLFDHTGAPLIQGPYGGDGTFNCNSTPQSTNYWDISDLDTTGGSFTVRDVIGPDINGGEAPNATHQEVSVNVGVVLRSMHIYTATQVTCGEAASAFGTRPADFHFTQYDISEEGAVSATLNVPAAWGTSVLGSGFDMEWYLRSDTVFEPIPVTNAKLLNVNFNLFDLVPAGSDPTTFQIEGRVKYDPDGGDNANASYVSVESPLHTLQYQLSGATYENEEIDPDDFLDPGEVANLNYNLINESSLGISDLTLVISNPNPNNVLLYNGVLLDEPLNQSFGSMNPGQTQPVAMELSLIEVDPALVCGNLELRVETSFTHDGVSHRFVDMIDIPVNCSGSVADNYFQIEPTPTVTSCGVPIAVVVNNQSFAYQYRFYTSLGALIDNTVSEINGTGVWEEPIFPTSPDMLPATYYVTISAANLNETRRIAPVTINAFDDGNCDPCGAFDVNNDDVVNATDFSLNAAQTWSVGGMLDLVNFIIGSQQAGCFTP